MVTLFWWRREYVGCWKLRKTQSHVIIFTMVSAGPWKQRFFLYPPFACPIEPSLSGFQHYFLPLLPLPVGHSAEDVSESDLKAIRRMDVCHQPIFCNIFYISLLVHLSFLQFHPGHPHCWRSGEQHICQVDGRRKRQCQWQGWARIRLVTNQKVIAYTNPKGYFVLLGTSRLKNVHDSLWTLADLCVGCITQHLTLNLMFHISIRWEMTTGIGLHVGMLLKRQ